MKKIYLLFILWCPFLTVAQEKLPFADGQEIIKLAAQAGSEGNYEKSLEILKSIHPNDSSFSASLVPKSFYLLNTGRYKEAIEVTDQGLRLEKGSQSLSFYINKGLAQMKMEEFEEALSTMEEALRIYPRNYELWYYQGLILEEAGKKEEAVIAFQQSILLNPSNPSPHLRLGNICYKQELTAQAMMAFNMYLLLNPDGNGSFNVLKDVNELVSIKNPNKADQGLEISGADSSFEQLNLLLDNRLALNSEYKVDSKIDIALTKQNHLLLQQLNSYSGNSGFWAEVYVPLYQWVWENGHFDSFTKVVSFSVENEAIKKIVSKDVEGLKSFRGSLLSKWGEILQPPTFRILEKDKGLHFIYSELKLDGIGRAEGETYIGEWLFYNAEGFLKGQGSFTEKGKKTGLWKWYHDNGTVKETAVYRDGLLNGENKGFFNNGKLKYIANYKNDQLEGEYLFYNNKGALLERKAFKNGVLEGEYQSYFPVGEILKEFDVVYRNGLIEEKAFEYYANGQVYAEMSFKGGEKNGVEKRFNDDGSLFSEVSYSENQPTGAFQTFYPNGNVNERSTYKNGLFEGPYESFYEDGTKKVSGNVKDGLYQGVFKYFDTDGKLHYEYDYKNGEIISYRYFNKKGEILAAGKRKGGEFYYRSFSPHGLLTSEGLYDVEGGKKGIWKFYSKNQVLTGEGEYIEDKASGLYTQYYDTGEKFSEATYKQDTLDGYYRDFFLNGQIQSQGWYKKGEQHGEWRNYYPDGKLKAVNYFHKGNYHGLQEYFGVEGKITSTLLYEFGEVLKESFYDPKGNLFEEIDRSKIGENTHKTHHYNTLVSHETYYVRGIKHGPYLQYDHQGQKIEEGEFLNGRENGVWTTYYSNGNKKRVLNLSRGNLHGETISYFENGQPELIQYYQFGKLVDTSKYFHENGELDVLTPYALGEENGRKEFYDPSGRLELVRFYEHGRLIGYSYLDENSQELPMIPLHNETGKITSYFDNGKLAREMEYINGSVVGAYRSYYYSGQLKFEAVYNSGKYHGKIREFYPNGELKSEDTYFYGELHGPSAKYFENGQLKEEVNYAYDLRHGTSVFYNEKGEQIELEQYYNGNYYEAENL